MQVSRMSRSFRAVTLAVVAVLSFTVVLCAASLEPYNKVVIIIDNSGSFSSSHPKAMDKAIELLSALSRTQTHRWETAPDLVTVISLDALPEALWTGDVKELKAKDPSFWTARFSSRRDYGMCTDVGAAFRLAAAHLEGDTRYVGKYLFAFSDLVHEPAGNSISKPRTRSDAPPDDFPWEDLRDVQVCVFWLPPDQKLVWHREIQRRGLTSFALYTTSESHVVSIRTPSRPTLEYTEAERRAARDRYMGYARRLVAGAVVLFAAATLLLVAIAVALRRGWARRLARILRGWTRTRRVGSSHHHRRATPGEG